jgi:hypothetical protein
MEVTSSVYEVIEHYVLKEIFVMTRGEKFILISKRVKNIEKTPIHTLLSPQKNENKTTFDPPKNLKIILLRTRWEKE